MLSRRAPTSAHPLGGVLFFALAISAVAQSSPVPPAAVAQLQTVIGNRVELGTILGGDYAEAGGIYTFRGGSVAQLSLTKLGGGGDVAEPKPLGLGDFKWAPVLQGNLGRFQTENDFASGYLDGNKSSYDTVAAQLGAGARFYFTDHLSLAPTLSGLYGHTENEFQPANPIGNLVKATASGTYVDWTVDTWSIVPALDLRYDWLWGRTAFEFRSRYNFFHTESFRSLPPLLASTGTHKPGKTKSTPMCRSAGRCSSANSTPAVSSVAPKFSARPRKAWAPVVSTQLTDALSWILWASCGKSDGLASVLPIFGVATSTAGQRAWIYL